MPLMDPKKRDFRKEILEFISERPAGSTITDIAKGIDTSRITVTKYVSVLEAKEKIFSKKIGAYSLYFTTERTYYPRKFILSYYDGLLECLRSEITDKEIYKKIGKSIANKIAPYYISYDETISTKPNSLIRFLKYLGKILPQIDYLNDKYVEIDVEINETGTEALYRLRNVKIFEQFKDLHYHYYIECGVLEGIIKAFLNKEVECNIVKLDKENQIVELKLVFN
ncbi:MAG: hypothetical protein BAJALOKI1v1_30031 [Promethearchaeota archaeon]|nr:MAG: hypothetical protein BAJALOKI1v1_30031 [Candidatus Lokiarchaeota archaeon]